MTVTLASVAVGATDTTSPGTVSLLESRMVTKKVDGVVPSAVTVEGEITTEERLADTEGPVETPKVTVAVWVTATVSVVSVAVKVTVRPPSR